MTEPSWVLGKTPEETIRLTIAALGMDVEEFAMRGLLPRSHFERVVAGAEAVTHEIVEGMERVVGAEWPYHAVDTWLSLDDWLEGDEEEDDSETSANWDD